MKQAYIKLHIAVILAGFTGLFGRLISLNAALISWYRLFFSALIMLLIFAIRGKFQVISNAAKIKIGFTGFLLGIHWILFYGSIKYSNVSVGVVCFALSSFFNALFNPIVNKRKLSVQELLLSGLTLLGIGLIFGMDVRYRTGIMLGVISSMFAALYTLYSERSVKDYDGQTFVFWQMSGGCIGLTVLMPIVLWVIPVKTLIPTAADFGWLLLLAAFCTVLLYFLANGAMKKIPSFTVSLSFNLEPLYTVVLAVIIFKEGREFNAGFYLGLLLIISSLLLQMYRLKRAQQTP